MSEINVSGSCLGNELQALLIAPDISPGDQASYQICKSIYLWHPMGAKIVERPVKMAQSQKRDIVVTKIPLPRIIEAFEKEWKRLKVDNAIFNIATQARIYGIASVAMVNKDIPPERPLPFKALANIDLSFNIFDPLNTAGSLVLNQNPNDPDFQHITDIRVNGKTYHRSRSCVLMHENPIYIAYTTSSFGYVGRSAYQRALYPLKSFIQTMVCDDMVANKAGVIVAKIKQPGSIIDRAMQTMFAVKRNLVKEARNYNVISVSPDEAIESLNLQNIDGSMNAARHNIIENIATGAAMPSTFLLEESFAEGFGDGTEDSKYSADYIGEIRDWMQPLYDYFTQIVQYRAWTPDFYKAIQNDIPEEFQSKGYTQFFYDCRNSFDTTWPSLIKEPPSEQIKVADVKLKAAIAAVEIILPALDPVNKALAIEWLQDSYNELDDLFPNSMQLDFEALASYEPPTALEEPSEPKPFATNDSQRPGLRAYLDAVGRLIKDADKLKEHRKALVS